MHQTEYIRLLKMAEASRSDYRAKSLAAGSPDPVAGVRELSIPAEMPKRTIAARLYRPLAESVAPLPLILFLHGGGFISGDLDTHDLMARRLANESKSVVVAIQYRLAPEHPFPAAADDAFAALCWLTANANTIKADSTKLAVAGDSAGGNLAAVACLMARDKDGPRICAQVLFYPVLNGLTNTASRLALGDRYFPTLEVLQDVFHAYAPLGQQQVLQPWVTPMRADVNIVPPALIITAEFDPLKDEGRAYSDKLSLEGIWAECTEYAGVGHGFVQFFTDSANQPQGELALVQAGGFVRKCFEAQPA